MFTKEEIAMLFEALDALEKSKMQDALIHGVFGMLCSDDREEASSQFDYEFEKSKPSTELKERIILLKAKLIRAKDQAFVTGITGDMLKG